MHFKDSIMFVPGVNYSTWLPWSETAQFITTKCMNTKSIVGSYHQQMTQLPPQIRQCQGCTVIFFNNFRPTLALITTYQIYDHFEDTALAKLQTQTYPLCQSGTLSFLQNVISGCIYISVKYRYEPLLIYSSYSTSNSSVSRTKKMNRAA